MSLFCSSKASFGPNASFSSACCEFKMPFDVSCLSLSCYPASRHPRSLVAVPSEPALCWSGRSRDSLRTDPCELQEDAEQAMKKRFLSKLLIIPPSALRLPEVIHKEPSRGRP